MAHSIPAVKNSSSERLLWVPDSTLHLFMHMFSNELSDKELGTSEQVIYDRYRLLLSQNSGGDIDLKLQEVYVDRHLVSWYIIILKKVESTLESFGDAIDHQYLNSLKLQRSWVSPLPVTTLRNLINDLQWVLNEEASYPSEHYKYMELPIDSNLKN